MDFVHIQDTIRFDVSYLLFRNLHLAELELGYVFQYGYWLVLLCICFMVEATAR